MDHDHDSDTRTSHDPLCVLSEPCDQEEPKHGYCGFSAPLFCIHCRQWCICERLAKARADEREQAGHRIALAAWEANPDVSAGIPVDLAVRAARDNQGEA